MAVRVFGKGFEEGVQDALKGAGPEVWIQKRALGGYADGFERGAAVVKRLKDAAYHGDLSRILRAEEQARLLGMPEGRIAMVVNAAAAEASGEQAVRLSAQAN